MDTTKTPLSRFDYDERFEENTDEKDAVLSELLEKRVIDMTGNNLYYIVKKATESLSLKTNQNVKPELPALVYGIQGLAKLLGCSDTTAWRLKRSGIFNDAMVQYNGKIVFITKKVLETTGEKKSNNIENGNCE